MKEDGNRNETFLELLAVQRNASPGNWECEFLYEYSQREYNPFPWPVGTTTVTSDGNGNIRVMENGTWRVEADFSRQNTAGSRWGISGDYENRLLVIRWPGYPEVQFVYDAVGRKMKEIVIGGAETRFINDGQDRIAQERDAGNNKVEEYFWDGGRLYKQGMGANVRFSQTQISGTPERWTDSTGLRKNYLSYLFLLAIFVFLACVRMRKSDWVVAYEEKYEASRLIHVPDGCFWLQDHLLLKFYRSISDGDAISIIQFSTPSLKSASEILNLSLNLSVHGFERLVPPPLSIRFFGVEKEQGTKSGIYEVTSQGGVHLLKALNPEAFLPRDFAIIGNNLFFTEGAPLGSRRVSGDVSFNPPIIEFSLDEGKSLRGIGMWNPEYLDALLHNRDEKNLSSSVMQLQALKLARWEKWSRDGKFIPPVRSLFDPQGIWVVDYSYRRLFRMGYDGTVLWFKRLKGSYENWKISPSLSLTPSGEFVLVQGKKLFRYNTSGYISQEYLPVAGNVLYINFASTNQICLVTESPDQKLASLLVLYRQL